MDERDPDVLDLRDYLAVLRRQRRTIAATVAIVVAVALGVTLLQTPVYDATAEIAVEPPAERGDLERILFGATELGTQQQILISAPLIHDVLAEHDMPRQESDIEEFLDDQVKVDALDDTTVLQVTVSDERPRRAASLAQSMADGYLAYLQRDADQRLEEALADLQTNEATTREELRSVEQQLADDPGRTRESLEEERDELYARLRWISTRGAELQTTNAFMRRGDIIRPAVVPDEPSSPKPLRTGVLALVLGGMLGVGLAFLRDWTDDRVRDEAGVRAVGAGPVLGMIPSPASGERATIAVPDGDTADAYRRLRTSVLALEDTAASGELRLAVVPAGADSDAAGVATNLAASLARVGRRVVLVDADLRRGLSSQLLDLDGPGLAELLSGEVDRVESVVAEPVPGLRVLPAGTPSAEARERLAGAGFGRLLDELGASAEQLLIAVPAMESGAEGLDVAARVRDALLVAHPATTTKTQLATGVEQLQQVGASVVGTVLTEEAGQTADAAAHDRAADGGSRQAASDPAQRDTEPVSGGR